jgi:hypothetical protein
MWFFPDPIPELSMDDKACFDQLEAKRGPLKGLYRYLFHHPEMIRRFSSLGDYLRFQGTLPQEIRSYIILSIASKFCATSVFETHMAQLQHEQIPLPWEIVKHLQQATIPSVSPYEEIEKILLFRHQLQAIPQELIDWAKGNYSEKGWIEIIMLYGFYQMLITSSRAFCV